MDIIRTPKPCEPIMYKRRGTRQIHGVGVVKTCLKYPQYYIEPLRRWFNKIMWYPRETGPNTIGATVTLLECAIDLELSIGLCLGSIAGETLT